MPAQLRLFAEALPLLLLVVASASARPAPPDPAQPIHSSLCADTGRSLDHRCPLTVVPVAESDDDCSDDLTPDAVSVGPGPLASGSLGLAPRAASSTSRSTAHPTRNSRAPPA